MKDKTNLDLLAKISSILLLVSIIIFSCFNGWKGSLQSIVGYFCTIFIILLLIGASNKLDDFRNWLSKPLSEYKIFGIKIKFFSKLW